MARDLAIVITVDKSQAVPALRETDVAMTGVSTAAKQATTSTTQLQQAMTATATTARTSSAAYQVFNDNTREVQSNFTRAHDSLSKFDGVLGLVGIHLAPEIRALGELGGVAGMTAGSLGLVTTAGLVLATAMVSWKVTRMAMEFLELDGAVAKAWTSLIGFKDVRLEEAGAKADVLAKASKEAGHAITDFAEAMRINNDAFEKHQKNLKDSGQATEAWKAAMIELSAAGDGWKGTLDTIDGETVNAIQYYLEAGVSQGALAKAYELTDVQVKAVASSLTASTAAQKAEQKAVDDLVDAYAKLHTLTLNNAKKVNAELIVMQEAQAKRVNAAILSEFEAQTALNKAQGLDAAGAFIVQMTAAETLRIGLENLHKEAVAGISQKAQEQLLTDAFTKSLYDEAVALDAEFAALRRSNDELAKVPALKQAAMTVQFNNPLGSANSTNTDPAILNWLSQGYTLNEAMAIAGGYGQAILGHPGAAAAAQKQAGARASGGPVSGGASYLVGERGPELFTPGSSGTISPNGGGVGAISITINGNVDSASSARALGDRVADQLMRRITERQRITWSKS